VTVPPGGVTLQGLANLINDTDDIAVRAAVLAAAPNQYRLVLTSASTGEDGAFTITHALTGGSGVAFTDTDNDGISGDDAADNAVAATNARALVNNLQVESSSNNLEDVIPGASLTLLRKDAAETHQVTIATDYTAVETKVKAFITAYNDLMQFMSDQSALAQKGDAKNIARDPILRSLKTALRGAITAEHDLAVSSLGAAGIEFEGVSELALSPTRFREAMDASAGAVVDLFTAAFGAIETALEDYEASDGILAAARAQRTDYSKTLRDRIIDLEERLAARRAALQKEYIAADLAMSRINGQMGALSSLGSHYRLF
jgi:flagellar hook-associated protein 2